MVEKDVPGSNAAVQDDQSATQVVPIFKLFSFADWMDVLLMVLGTAGAVANGMTMPLMAIVFGELTDSFGQNVSDVDRLSREVSKVSLRFVYLGIVASIGSLFQLACWMCTGERQAARIRNLYLKAILRQDISFFDKETKTGEVIGRMSGDTILIQDAMGEKVSKLIQFTTAFFAGFVIAFIKGWKLTLVMMSVMPLLVFAGGMMANLMSKMASRGQKAYAEAAVVVEQVTGGIRTVASFTGERKSMADYETALTKAYKAGVFEGVASGAGLGFTLFTMFSSYGLALWYGSKLVLNGGYSGGDVISVLFAVLTGGMSLGQTSPSITAIASGRAAAYKMFEVIRRVPLIDAFDMSGQTLESVKGDIELRDVTFSYPTRPDVPVFTSFNLEIPSGTTVALVGESGSGKSTVISLIERFYDPQAGEVLIDGVDIRKLQPKWLRQQIGLVSQEPVLFATSIRENIAYGREGATEEEIMEAARLANAAKFISKMPKGFDTQVGEHGTQLSGGQKQRVAIARAILKNPRILLLDEATSALDAESERVVQEALDRIMVNRTTVIVAHRLSTIKNADCIAVVQRGSIVEKGTHSELIQRPDGAYEQLVRLQEMHDVKSNQSLSAAQAIDPDEVVVIDQELDERRLSRSSSRGSFGSKRNVTRSSFSLTRTASVDPEQADKSDGKTGVTRNNFLRLAAMNKPETPVFIVGALASTANGVVFPVFGLLLSNIFGVLYSTNRHKLRHDANFWASMFLVQASACLIISPIQLSAFGFIGQRLIRRVRKRSFESVVRQEIAWFDDPSNSSGAISSRLSVDAAHVKSMVGDSLSLLLQNLASLIAGLVIAFTANWILSLVVLALIPLLGAQGVVQTKMMIGFSKDAKVMYEEATKIANDAVSSIRTVSSYCLEAKMLELYKTKCSIPTRNGIRNGVVSGIGLGISSFVMFAAYAFSFWFGARLVREGKTSFQNVFKVFFAITMSAFGIAQGVSLAPDFAKVKSGVNSIFATLDRKSKIDPSNEEGKTLESTRGDIEFRNVRFRYPARHEAEIFRNLSFSIPAGKTMALVGESGSGKSTVISLLERFYDPDSGSILIDGVDIRSLKLRWLRQNIALVSQEPTLFSGSIRSNIAYGRESGAPVSEEEITAAAKAANAHSFISAMPGGYETEVGERGIQLSGGQKQRIAIARAVLKEPKILLLDEATSALDAESERLVQEALDRIMVGKTSVVVAHRLSTIVGVDMIAVVKNGGIVEQGSHEELITKPNGAYATLVKLHRHKPAS
ncbi:hypothetical protein SELMODRAFT_184079 [Selaginella moellendorffii]|uniref:Uncharacterized protein PGP4B-2 n=1 Tax=Selaginella moellendorffii TaxID=88036 RepID=D8SZH1_SELML|nr:ABC transporter B family member 21 [Selaginella moellendorffii]EFJ10214.1 hypothetical protein SELMODRAFT_184079 [Selaginella moellendorffii]|eukprot:XP_002988703.1 ABC transporter B family member 21 [Selaginella moellendorffii]